MNRNEKINVASQLKEDLQGQNVFGLISFSGLSSEGFVSLRRAVKGAGGRVRIVKNKIALKVLDSQWEAAFQRLKGPVALFWGKDNSLEIAKALAGFEKEHAQKVSFPCMLLQDEGVKEVSVATLSKIPDLVTLRCQLISAIQFPGLSLVRVLSLASKEKDSA